MHQAGYKWKFKNRMKTSNCGINLQSDARHVYCLRIYTITKELEWRSVESNTGSALFRIKTQNES